MTTPDMNNAAGSNRSFWVLLTLLLLIGASITGYEYWRGRQAAVPPPPPVIEKPAAPSTAPAAIPLPSELRERIDLLIYDALVPPINKTEKELIAALGAPVRTTARSIPNRHEPSKPDTLRTLVYPGMTIDFLRVTHTGGEFPTGITVTGPKVWVKWDLNVGTTEKTVLKTLGKPKSRTATSLTYEYSIAPSTVVFHLRNGAVVKIVWAYYVD
jgi:hypothetical protein